MSFVPVVPKTIHKTIRKSNAIYHSVMEVSYRGPDEQDISQSNYDQRHNLRALIVRMHERHVDVGQLLTQGTIVRNQGGRIDSQSPGIANIQYQIRNTTYAATIIEVFPTATENCPELATRRIDDREFGFTINHIMGFLQDGLEFSAHRRGYTDITWRIMRVDTTGPRQYGQIERFIATGAKIATKVAAKEVGQVAAKELGKMGSEAVLKKIPVAGLIFGSIFALWRLGEGDYQGAAMEMASGIAATIPGGGTAASIGIDAALLARDLHNMEAVEFHV